METKSENAAEVKPSEREHPEEGRQHAAPPSGAEPGGLVVAERLVDFLLEHPSPPGYAGVVAA